MSSIHRFGLSSIGQSKIIGFLFCQYNLVLHGVFTSFFFFFSNLKNCKYLERMDLEECNQITDLTLAHLATGCPSLEKLVNKKLFNFLQICYDLNLVFQTLSHCELITDDGIRQLAAGSCAAESLSVLELDNCPLITDQTLEHLVSCHNLQRIELYDCQMITRAAIRRLRVNIYYSFRNFSFPFLV